MPNNEEQHKKVVFFKKAAKITKFEHNIIPIFPDTKDSKTGTKTDSYGTWSFEASCASYNNYRGPCEVLDGDDETYWASAKNLKTMQYFSLYCPEGISIAPSKIEFSISQAASDPGSIILQGRTSKSGSWQTLYSGNNEAKEERLHTYINNNNNIYYTDFRVGIVPYGTLNFNLSYIKILSGNIKQSK